MKAPSASSRLVRGEFRLRARAVGSPVAWRIALASLRNSAPVWLSIARENDVFWMPEAPEAEFFVEIGGPGISCRSFAIRRIRTGGSVGAIAARLLSLGLVAEDEAVGGKTSSAIRGPFAFRRRHRQLPAIFVWFGIGTGRGLAGGTSRIARRMGSRLGSLFTGFALGHQKRVWHVGPRTVVGAGTKTFSGSNCLGNRNAFRPGKC